MRGWLSRVLARISWLASKRNVRFTFKARSELAALKSGLDREDAYDVLALLWHEDEGVGHEEKK